MNGADAAGGGALFHPEDLACPICVETIEDAFATPCGHTFCFKCISTHLKNKSTCPSCGAHLVQDQIHPNFLLNKLIQRAARAQDGSSLKTALLQHVQHDLAAAGPSIGLQELDTAIQLLQEKRQQVATHESSNKLQLLMLFLQHAKAKQLGQLSDLEQQLDVLQQDLAKARAAAATAAAGGGGGNTSSQPDGTAAAAAAAGGSRPLTPGSQQQQQQTAVSGGGGAAVPVPGGSLLGGRGSAFKRLQPAGGFAAQQQPEQQQQQGFRSLTGQQPQQGFRLLPKPQQPQQQQATAPAGQQGFKPFSQQQQQQQQQASPKAGGQLVGASLAQNPSQPSEQRPAAHGFRPFAAQAEQQQQQQGFRPLQAPHPGQQQQQQGFRPLAPAQAAIDAAQQQQQQQGSRPLPTTQGLDEASLNPEKKRKIMEQFDELQQAYLSSRLRQDSQTGSQPPLSPLPQPPAVAAAAGAAAGAGVGAFQPAAADEGVGQQQQWAWPEGAALGESSRHFAMQAAPQQQQQQQEQHGIAAADGSDAAAAAADFRPVGAALTPAGGDEGVLDAFSRMLYAVTHYSKLQPLAYVPPPSSSSSSGGAQILSSIEFDCAGQLFAAAGVQQRILVHSYATVLTHGGPQQQQQQQQQAVAAAAGSSGGQEGPGGGSSAAAAAAAEPLAPLLDLSTGSKISCLSFSPAVQQYLLSSDYAGVAQLWDLTGGRAVRQWEAHDKRIWAVDFCPLDATTFATGSDDGTVKVWGLCEAPVPRLTLPVRANVCSIKFSPAAPHMLAAGNAGHQVQLFDLRAPRGPLAVLKGHSKAVSYVRWAGPDALVSASTDSTLRLWTAAGGRGSSDSGRRQQQQQGTAAAAAAGGGGGGGGGGWDCEEGGWHCSQVFRGHSNSKHFVGLATQGPFIVCGSETNEVFMYHQGLAQPSLRCLLSPWGGSSSHSSGGAGAAGGEGTAGAGAGAAAAAGVGGAKSPFVSALCWKKGSDVLVAANSKGGVWVLSMQ